MRKINKILAVAAVIAAAACTPVSAAEAVADGTVQTPSAGDTAQTPSTGDTSQTQPPADGTTQVQPQKKRGLVKEGTKYVYYDKNGKKLKNKWKTIKKSHYYFDGKGYAVTGRRTIGNYIYVFDQEGKQIRPSKAQIVKVGNTSYYLDTKGRAYVGFFKLGNKLYRGDPKGRLNRNKTIANITFTSKCYAKNDVNAKLKKELMSVISRITSPGMTKSQKLYACWNYLTHSGNFYYSTYWPDFNEKGWQREVAYRMLTTGAGDCYGFACTFAALAREIGYDPYVVLGRVTGTRDGAADGLTSHGWVIIGGAYYDPEAEFAGWYRGVYGNGSYDINHQIQRIVRFAS